MTFEIAGIVLAGGRATRLGGGDKPLRTIGGQSILDIVLKRLKPQVGPVAISANGDPARFAEYRLPVLGDEGPRGQAGPLAGVLSALSWARTSGISKALTVAGDTPFFPRDLAQRLNAAVDTRPDHVAVAASASRTHPIFALWPVSLTEDLRQFLAESATLSVTAFLERHDTVSVDFPMADLGEDTVDPFFNINTPEQLAAADEIARTWNV